MLISIHLWILGISLSTEWEGVLQANPWWKWVRLAVLQSVTLWLSEAPLILLQSATHAKSTAAPGPGWKHLPHVGGNCCHPDSCCTRVSWSSVRWHTPQQETLLASGIQLLLKSRMTHCSYWHTKSLLVPATHVVGCPVGWRAQHVASSLVLEIPITIRGPLPFLRHCTNIFQGDGLP